MKAIIQRVMNASVSGKKLRSTKLKNNLLALNMNTSWLCPRELLFFINPVGTNIFFRD